MKIRPATTKQKIFKVFDVIKKTLWGWIKADRYKQIEKKTKKKQKKYFIL